MFPHMTGLIRICGQPREGPMRITDHTHPKATPQSQPVPGKGMVKNDAGAFAFQQSDMDRMKRFVMIGTEGGTYYANERDVTVESAEATLRAVVNQHREVTEYVVSALREGRVYKLDAALYTFALCCSNGTDDDRSFAMSHIPTTLRTGTQLFKFLQYVKVLRGTGGSGLQRWVTRWFTTRDVGNLENQFIKYFSREGMSFRDVLRIARPGTRSKGRDGFVDPYARALIAWAVKGGDKSVFEVDISGPGEEKKTHSLPRRISAAHALHSDITKEEKVGLIKSSRLPREAVPTEMLNDPSVWEALLESMPVMATVRNLGKMTSIGLLTNTGSAKQTVIDRLTDEEAVAKSLIHPFHLLMAARTYSKGRGDRGSLTWQPVDEIVEALSDAFDIAVAKYGRSKIVELTLLAIDTSASMGGHYFSNRISGGFQPREIAAMMAYVFRRMGANCDIIGFDTAPHAYSVTKRSTIDSILRNARSGGGTNCSIPARWAIQKAKHEGTVFSNIVMVTDSESWAGWGHTFQDTEEFRSLYNPEAKAVEIQVASSREGTQQLPEDPRNLQVVGFDASTYSIVEDFLSSK